MYFTVLVTVSELCVDGCEVGELDKDDVVEESSREAIILIVCAGISRRQV